jgi:hypothetical protein
MEYVSMEDGGLIGMDIIVEHDPCHEIARMLSHDAGTKVLRV